MASVSRTKSSEVSASRRSLSRARDLYIDLFRDTLTSMLSTDNETIKELTDREVEEITNSSAKIADASLRKIEERFPGL